MSNTISSSAHAGIQTYHTRSNSPEAASSAQEAQSADAKDQARPAASHDALDAMKDLTSSEKEMIREEFPEAPDLSMRLYGADRDAKSVNPHAVGQRLDVQA